ncbi:hypothetical protein ACOBV9_21050 (plasmid) [Pseudoalteromonas espejiana]
MINNEHLNSTLTHLLQDNPWTGPLLEAEQQPKSSLMRKTSYGLV